MTTGPILRLVLRRWYVILAGSILTLIAAALVIDSPPAYYSRMEVRFVEAGIAPGAAYLEKSSPGAVPFAAAVERVVNNGEPVLPLNSRSATLHGMGVRQGRRVAIPNYGTQWFSSYPVPALVIEVVDESPAKVVDGYRQALAEVKAAAQALQDEREVPSGARISVVPAAAEPSVVSVGSTRSGEARSLVAVSLVGIGLTAAAAVGWDRHAQLRSRRRRGSSPVDLETDDHAMRVL